MRGKVTAKKSVGGGPAWRTKKERLRKSEERLKEALLEAEEALEEAEEELERCKRRRMQFRVELFETIALQGRNPYDEGIGKDWDVGSVAKDLEEKGILRSSS